MYVDHNIYVKGWVVRGSNPGGGEIFRTRQDLPWDPPSHLYNRHKVSFTGVKRTVDNVDHPPTSWDEVEERVELYLYSPSGPSWSVLGWTLPLGLPKHRRASWTLLIQSTGVTHFVFHIVYVGLYYRILLQGNYKLYARHTVQIENINVIIAVFTTLLTFEVNIITFGVATYSDRSVHPQAR